MSCAGHGYLTGNTLVAFPFADDQCLAWPVDVPRAEAQRALERCFADAAVNLNVEAVDAAAWPRLMNFTVSGTTLSFVLTAAGASIPLSVAVARTPFPILSGRAPFGTYVLVLCAEAVRAFCTSDFPPPVAGNSSASWREEGSSLRLCPKCVTFRPVGLRTLRVYDGVGKKSDGPHFVLTGDIALQPGNNIQLTEPGETNGIRLNAVPGAGLGVVPCGCTGGEEKVSPLFSSDGHTRIFNDTCYDVEPQIRTEGGKRIGVLQMHAKCTACCTCEMYASLVNDRLAPIATRVRQAKSQIAGFLTDYEEAVARFNRRLVNPTLEDVPVSLSGMPVGSKLGVKLEKTQVKGKMGRCAFTAIVRNASFATLTATIYALSGTDEVVESTAAWSDADGNPMSQTSDWANGLVGKAFEIQPGRALVVTFISVRKELVGSVRTGGYTGSISVGLAYTASGGSGSLGIVKKTVEV